MITGVDLFEYTVRDKAKSVAFYRDVLGLKVTDDDEHGAEFTLSDGTTFGIWKAEEEAYPRGGHVLFAVDDINKAISQMRTRGARLSDVVETGVCFMSFGSDPEGNGFVIHQRKNRG
jgi:predicted enzyme related to lactoylglutathione lyase